ncbi:MAG: NfeD family protein [Calditrichia bacterium]
MEKLWLVWFIFGAIFVVGEMFTAGFFLLWFGVGAIAAGIADLLGLGMGWQWAIFAIVSGILVLYSRKFSEKITDEEPQSIGANRMKGKQGIVLETINPGEVGLVKVELEEWKAVCQNDMKLTKGTKIKVVQVDGTKLIVEPSEKEA